MLFRSSDLKVFGQGSGILVRRDGLIVASSHKEQVMKTNLLTDSSFPESLRDAIRRMTAGETGSAEYTHEGERRLMFYAPGIYLLNIRNDEDAAVFGKEAGFDCIGKINNLDAEQRSIESSARTKSDAADRAPPSFPPIGNAERSEELV